MRPTFLREHFGLFRLWILERPAEWAGSESPGPPGILVRTLNRHERRDWACEKAGERDWLQFKTALRHDHDLVLASEAGRVLGWAWIGYERVYLPPLGREIRLPHDTAYLYEAYVRPEARGRGIGSALVAARCRQATERHARRLLTHVVDGNLPSRRALTRHGFRVVGRTHFLKVLALRVWTSEPLPRAPVAAPGTQ